MARVCPRRLDTRNFQIVDVPEIESAQEQIKQRYLSDRGAPSHDPALAKAGAALQQLLANSGFLSRPAELLGTQGYGLPQP